VNLSAAQKSHRGVVAVAVILVGVLAVGSATLIVAVVNRGSASPNHAYGVMTCAAPPLPGATVKVALSDRGSAMMGGAPMMVTLRANPGAVGAGTVSFVVENRGALAHEMIVLPLAADGPGTRPTGSDGKIDESQSLGEASRSCAEGTGDGIAPGSTGWVTINLRPGRYELVCDEPWHYAAGMFDMLTVN
jgi:uncharacterized cupredoxin-like copper-binding protein